MCLIKTLIFSGQPVRHQWRVLSAALYLMKWENMTAKTVFFCGETDTITKDTRTAHGQKLTRLISHDECNRCTDGEENRDKQNKLCEQAQVHTKHFKRLQVFP